MAMHDVCQSLQRPVVQGRWAEPQAQDSVGQSLRIALTHRQGPNLEVFPQVHVGTADHCDGLGHDFLRLGRGHGLHPPQLLGQKRGPLGPRGC